MIDVRMSYISIGNFHLGQGRDICPSLENCQPTMAFLLKSVSIKNKNTYYCRTKKKKK